jgi:hypothetical protein
MCKSWSKIFSEMTRDAYFVIPYLDFDDDEPSLPSIISPVWGLIAGDDLK